MIESADPAGLKIMPTIHTELLPPPANPAPPAARRSRSQGASRHLADWGALLFSRALYAPRPKQADHASMSLCFKLRLDLASNTLPEWRVGGQTIATAQAIRQGAHRAARIEAPVTEAVQ